MKNAEQIKLPFAQGITVYCFFLCGHIVDAETPEEAHRLMEEHYSAKHTRQIDRIVGQSSGQKIQGGW